MNITKRKPFTPGEILFEEFMQPLNLTPEQVADRIGVPVQRINEIVNSQEGITPDIAIRLSRLFGTSVEYWLNMQLKIDLWHIINDNEKYQEYQFIKQIEWQEAVV
ncbi:MAG: addiction module antidote protein, HigA family [Candidatus Parabeggiatoa sp. nov. 2]|nr:MAG: addiction module antidote protein, HigA family [Beggiatoa sp. 4572_84]RKZ55166.1 MAG: addiction module antidote protein, HigA family [Gammaproteobacteria bacterium]